MKMHCLYSYALLLQVQVTFVAKSQNLKMRLLKLVLQKQAQPQPQHIQANHTKIQLDPQTPPMIKRHVKVPKKTQPQQTRVKLTKQQKK